MISRNGRPPDQVLDWIMKAVALESTTAYLLKPALSKALID